jgi:hypothetical protein
LAGVDSAVNQIPRLRRHGVPEVIECKHAVRLHDVWSRAPSAREIEQVLESARPIGVHAKWHAVDLLDRDLIAPPRDRL